MSLVEVIVISLRENGDSIRIIYVVYIINITIQIIPLCKRIAILSVLLRIAIAHPFALCGIIAQVVTTIVITTISALGKCKFAKRCPLTVVRGHHIVHGHYLIKVLPLMIIKGEINVRVAAGLR